MEESRDLRDPAVLAELKRAARHDQKLSGKHASCLANAPCKKVSG